jgi:protein TonB
MVARTATKHPLGALGRMGFVAGMHLALLLVLARSFGFVPVEKFEKGVGVFIDEPRPPDVPPPPVNPTVYQVPTISPMPPPVVPIDTGGDETITLPPELLTGQGEGEGGSAELVPVVVGARSDPRHPLSQPPYPPTDRREGNQGSVDVEIYVLANGRVGDARIVKSSGFERLDRVTLEEARRSWRMLPATRDGEPFAQWHRLRVVFKLKTE